MLARSVVARLSRHPGDDETRGGDEKPHHDSGGLLRPKCFFVTDPDLIGEGRDDCNQDADYDQSVPK